MYKISFTLAKISKHY